MSQNSSALQRQLRNGSTFLHMGNCCKRARMSSSSRSTQQRGRKATVSAKLSDSSLSRTLRTAFAEHMQIPTRSRHLVANRLAGRYRLLAIKIKYPTGLVDLHSSTSDGFRPLAMLIDGHHCYTAMGIYPTKPKPCILYILETQESELRRCILR
jgi:hypothetical protein